LKTERAVTTRAWSSILQLSSNKYGMRLFEVTSSGVLYHATTAVPALHILEDGGFFSSYDEVEEDKNGNYFVSTTTDPNLWWAAGFRDTANVTFVLNKPTDHELEPVNRWDEIRIMLGARPEDPYGFGNPDSPRYPVNRHTVREIWIRDQDAENGDQKYLQRVRDAATKRGITVVEKPASY
jgi:hypothetical protein